MLERLQTWFSPPTVMNNERDRVARLTQTILIVTMILSVVGGIGGTLASRGTLLHMVPSLVVIALEIAALWILKRGFVQTAAWAMVAVLWIGLAIISGLIGGINAATISLFIITVMVAALTTGWRGNLIFTLLSVLVISIFYVLELFSEEIPVVLGQTDENILVVTFISIVATSLLVGVSMQTLEHAITIANRRRKELEVALDVLQETSISSVYMDDILQSMLDMLVVLDDELCIKTVNESLCSTLGYSSGELEGKPFDMLLDEDTGNLIQHLNELKGGSPIDVMVMSSYRSKTGETLSVYVRANLLLAGMGTARVICVAQDLTDWLEMQKDLAEERNLLRTLIDTLPDMVYIKDKDLRFVVSNKRHAEHFGKDMTPEQLVGKTARDFEHSALIPTIEAEERKVLQGEILSDLPSKSINPAGEERDILITKVPLIDQIANEVTGLLAVVRDVTEQVAAERELAYERNLLRTILDSLPDYVHVKDTQGQYVLSNRAHMAVVGAKSQAEIIGKTSMKLFGEEIATPFQADDRYILETGKPLLGIERRAVDANGKEIWILSNKVPLHDDDGALQGIVAIATDITDRRRAEERIRESETRLRNVIQNAPVFIFAIDKNYNLTFFEGQGTPNIDIEQVGQALGQSMFELSDNGAEMQIADAVQAAFSGENAQSTVQMGEFAFDIRYSPIVDPNGEIHRMIGVATDVTERVRVEEALRHSEARNRAMLSAIPDLMFVLDDKGRHVEVKAEHPSNMVVRVEDILMLTVHDIFPDDDLADRYLDAIHTCLKIGKVQTLDYSLKTLGGDQHFEARLAKLNETEVVTIVRNITEQHNATEQIRRNEQMYRTLIHNLPRIAVMLYDTDLRFIIAEGGPLIDNGFIPEEVEGKSLRDVISNRDLAFFDDRYRRALAGETVNYERPTPNGRHYNTTIVPIYTDEQEIMGGLVVVIDVTEDRWQAQELLQYAEALERSNQELQDFAYVASHDLQEPLRKIQAFGDRLAQRADGNLDETALDYLARMQNAASRMQTLIQDLLAFSRITTKAQPFQVVDLNHIIKEALTDLELRIEQSNATVDVDSLPQIAADPLQMRQLFQNLIGNALKYTRPDVAPIIAVKATRVMLDDDQEFIEINVSDNGIGFGERHAERIFGLFQRLHSRNQYEGTGMGLAICRKIAERHNGTLHATGVEGQGATFTLRLPIDAHKHKMTDAQP
jgi:PAS domain S-box-containing protein